MNNSNSNSPFTNATDKRIKEICGTEGKLVAIKYCMEANNMGLKEAKDYVDNLLNNNVSTDNDTIGTSPFTNDTDKRIREICNTEGKLAAVKYCKESKNMGLKEAKDYVENLVGADGGNITLTNTTSKKEGCFIATACYGNYDAQEVWTLRNYRDNVLKKNYFGRLFVKFYYWVSPPVANAIAKSGRTKAFIRNHFLKHIVNKVK